jgi:hypothetical protein
LGDALANAGRGAPAAVAYRRAAQQADAARALDLRRRAADQLLRAGHIDEGLDAMRGVLSAIGMKLPPTPLATLVSFLFWLAYLKVRGLGFKVRDPSHIAPHALTRVDTCWSVAFSLSITDTLRGATFELRTLILSLEAGEVYRVARAMALHAGHRATIAGRRGWPQAERLLVRARELALQSGKPHAIGWAEGAAGIAYYTNGRFGEALRHLADADRIWRETPGAAWELDTMKVFMTNALAQLGRLRELCSRVPKYVREATERGDLYGAVNLRIGYANLRWLVVDEADCARREVEEAMQEWSKQGTHLEHFYELLARVNIALYTGETEAGLAELDERWKPLDRALLFRVQSLRILARFMRARLCVAEGVAKGARAAGSALLRRATDDAQAIARERMEWSRPVADVIHAACAHAVGDAGRAVPLLRQSIERFEASGMELHAAAARARLGVLVGGDEGAVALATSEAWMRDEGVVMPARIVAMMAPGFAPR